ncbi:MAG: hypothetical protein GY870_08540 [archaeon]|nr:hypothetical protein [archaeon]
MKTIESGVDALKKVIETYAPEISDIWLERRDSSEDQGVRTGRLHENHILGIIVKHHLEEEKDVTTTDIEEEYRNFFKKIARSTVSTYLNQLEKEGVLYKKRDGRTVKYLFQKEPPKDIDPFWITRNFCLLPPYISRAAILAQFYVDPNCVHEKYEKERLFLVGLTILTVLKNRIEKCHLCQFGERSFYASATDNMKSLITERIDVLPEELRNFILFELGELPLFRGILISNNEKDLNELFPKIIDFVERYHSDIEFQMSVSKHRQRVHLKRKEDIEE